MGQVQKWQHSNLVILTNLEKQHVCIIAWIGCDYILLDCDFLCFGVGPVID